jgi:hypothetical protein
VFESWELRRTFGPKGDGITGGRRKLHNEELHNLYYSLSIIRMIKSRIGLAEHEVRTGENRSAYSDLLETMKEIDH